MGMKISMNFSMDQDDLGRYANRFRFPDWK